MRAAFIVLLLVINIMKNLLLFISIIICVLVVGACSRPKGITRRSSSDAFLLSADRLVILEEAANKGDAHASALLSRHYAHVAGGDAMELLWLKRAAELGDATSQYNLAYILVYDSKNRDLVGAEKWLKKYEQSGEAKDAEWPDLVKNLHEEINLQHKNEIIGKSLH